MSELDASAKRSDLPKAASRGKLMYGLAGLAGLTIIFAIAATNNRKSGIELPRSVSSEAAEEARRDFEKRFRKEADEADVMMTLAENAVRDEQPEIAIDCFERIPSTHRKYGSNARFQEAKILLKVNRADRAENSFRKFLTLEEKRSGANRKNIRMARAWLALIMTIELRFEERKRMLQKFIEDDEFDVYDAKERYFPSLVASELSPFRSRLRDFLEQAPTSRPLLIAQARYLVREGKLDAADKLLQSLQQQYPTDREVLTAKLECLFELADWDRFESVMTATPKFETDEPWLLTQMRAEFARHMNDWQSAGKYFQKVLESDPANPASHMGLASVLHNLEKTDERKVIQDRSLTLAKIRVYLSAVNQKSPAGSRALAEDAKSLGMLDAAQCFNLLADRIQQGGR